MDHTVHPPTTSKSAVAVLGLRKTWPGGVEAVAGIDFAVAPGEVFGLLGPNGAGKSTTIGMLTTTVVPTAGRAFVGGYDVARHPIAARAASAVVFQDAVVDRALSGRRNLELHARLWGVTPTDTARRIAEHGDHFGLADLLDRPVATYSGGQRRRLELARSLLSTPEVLFLDEPTVGLDPRIRYELIDLIARLRDRWGVTVVVTTHYLDEAERLCDRVGIMHAGSIVALDTPAALLAGIGREVLELRVDGDAVTWLRRLQAERLAGDDAFVVGSTISIPMHDRRANETVAAIDRLDVHATATSTRPPSLDDVYLRLTGDRLAADHLAA
jgi:ABC-2 type transport system ATP-binding protein